MITNIISVAGTAVRNGHGWSVLKGSWIISLLAVAPIIILISSRPEDSLHKLNSKMEEELRKPQSYLSINRKLKNQSKKPKRMSMERLRKS